MERVLAELREVRRVAWEQEPANLDTVLKALKQERDLLGLDSQKDYRFQMELQRYAEKAAAKYGFSVDEIVAEAESIIADLPNWS